MPQALQYTSSYNFFTLATMRFFTIASVLFTAAVSVLASPVVERQTPQSAAVVLTDLSNTVTPLANQLLYATPENATQATLTPIIGDISTAVTSAVSSLNLLVGQPTNVIMASVDGTTVLGASDIATLLSVVVNLIFTATNAVLLVVDITIYSVIYALVAALGQVLLNIAMRKGKANSLTIHQGSRLQLVIHPAFLGHRTPHPSARPARACSLHH
ncbi:hypothetical protein J3R83DRAFT_2818 [Lanmaoa asiatica]|nr:hypothetical protein J3R83DRAFT_2818 [Lanmaoa asiatica]